MSDAIESQGFKLEIGNADSPLTYTEVKEIVSFNAFDGQATVIDVTHMQSTAKEVFMGLQDFGTFTGDTNYLTADPGQVLLRQAKGTREIQDFRMTLANGTTATFRGYVLSSPISGGVDAKIDGSFSIQISGDVVGTVIEPA